MQNVSILTCFFNPSQSEVLVQNFRKYVEGLGPFATYLIVVECVFAGRPPQLDFVPNRIVVQSNSVLWQKERLLNIALDHLPAAVDVVVWLDGDVLFDTPDWLFGVTTALAECDILQPFSEVWQADDPTSCQPSFAALVSKDPGLGVKRFQDHGHTGYGWAVRADIVRAVGFFDKCVIGGADHVMAHSFLQHGQVACLEPLLGPPSAPLYRAWARWSERVSKVIGRPSVLGCVQGRIRHLPHGSKDARRYIYRNRLLHENGFDPDRDLRMNSHGCWEWRTGAAKPRLLTEKYFAKRQEDVVVR